MGTTIVHLIIPLVILGLWRKFSKKDIPLWTVLLAGLITIMIDVDYLFDFGYRGIDMFLTGVDKYTTFHRVWTHSMIWPILLGVGATAVRLLKKDEYKIFKWTIPKTHMFYALLFSSVALFLYLALDCALAGPFYLSWIPPGTYEGSFSYCSAWLSPKGNIIISTIILTPWFMWMVYRNNFKDVI